MTLKQRAERIMELVEQGNWSGGEDATSLARAYLAREAEIERLTASDAQHYRDAQEQYDRAEASEARTADLLKALEGLQLWCNEALIFVRDGSADTAEDILMTVQDRIRPAIAAAKGETV